MRNMYCGRAFIRFASIAKRNMATQTEQNKASPLLKLIQEYKKTVKAKGPVLDWPDAFLIKLRDRYRDAARKYRGKWSIEFYETLQDINKESLKRGQED